MIQYVVYLFQGSVTPVLHLENLEVGDYTFTLKVTDSGGQTATADVHVFVKAGTVNALWKALFYWWFRFRKSFKLRNLHFPLISSKYNLLIFVILRTQSVNLLVNFWSHNILLIQIQQGYNMLEGSMIFKGPPL